MSEEEKTVKTRKKLIEVALPLDAINRGCIEDKNRKTGHIRNVHKWFAPMPLPSWRAMLFAALVDDPDNYLSGEAATMERNRLLEIVARLGDFHAYRDRDLLQLAQDEIRKSLGDSVPTIVDPFCGGGSTILEAQRLGLGTRGSDLNPIPVIITTILCRATQMFKNRRPIRPDFNSLISERSNIESFREDIVYYATKVREIAWNKLSDLYPSIEGATPFAYRWAWTVETPNPAFRGMRTPLVSNWWLSRHKRMKRWIKPVVTPTGIDFSIQADGQPSNPTTHRSGAACLFSNADAVIPLSYIREKGREGKLSTTLVAIAAREKDQVVYYPPNELQQRAALNVPSVDLPGIEMPPAALSFRVQQYGITNFLDLFTKRQAYALKTFAESVRDLREVIARDARAAGMSDDPNSLESGGQGAIAYADAIVGFLGLCVGRLAQSNNILVRWFIDPRNGTGKATPAFDRHAVPMVWDFVETNPFGGSVGDWLGPVVETALRALDLCPEGAKPSTVVQQDARKVAEAVASCSLVATDPPYYANIGYADLSDFFYLWLRIALRDSFPLTSGTAATPKSDELIATPFRHEGSIEAANEYFRTGFGDVFGRLAEKVTSDLPMIVVYAIKQSEESEDGIASTGWEVFLGGLLDAGLEVVATWPVRTTTDSRMIGIGTNALASAVFVIVRRRPAETPPISTREFLVSLRAELPRALKYLQSCSIAPVDLAQAAIGPGMAIYSRYSKVLNASGEAMTVNEALRLINETLDETLAEQEGDFDADTRWALTWFEQHGFGEGSFGEADVLSRAKNTSVDGMTHAGILEAGAGKVRLLKPEELDADWSPEEDTRQPVWEMLHHLIRALNHGGEMEAAALVARFGGHADTARELAYRLYLLCERKKRAQNALAYNGLVQSWPEIRRLASEAAKAPTQPQQTELYS